jgi:hypothetical protein
MTFRLKSPLRLIMASSVAPTGWVEQVLKTADLSVLLPKASWWAEFNGCRASDVDEKSAMELVIHLGLRACPSRRLFEIIMQAVEGKSLVGDALYDPCHDVKIEEQDFEAADESEPDQDLPVPSPSIGPSGSDGSLHAALVPGLQPQVRQWCVTHEKWRDHSKMRLNSNGEYVCTRKHECVLHPTSHQRAARSPRPHGKRRRTDRKWDSEDISAHIAGLGRYPENSGGLRRENDGSFSLDSLMAFWGNEAGLSVETIQMALQAHLFKHIGRRNPTLRFSISQGSDPRDPVMIKVPHPAGV